jgi:hypothetical protein
MRQKETLNKISQMQKHTQVTKEDKIMRDLEKLPATLGKVTVLMCLGGNFSVGVFQGLKEITHKSDHRYVVRGKGGGKRQSEKDKEKKIKSSGSQIRRLNEKKHLESVNGILEAYMDHLVSSDLILIHAPGENEAIMFDEGRALDKFRKMDKIRSIGSLTGKKANWNEVRRVYEEVTKLYVFDDGLK